MKTKHLFDPVGVLHAVNRMLEYGEPDKMNRLTIRILPAGDDQPRTDMVKRIIYVPGISAGASVEDQNKWLAYVWHEAGHHHPHQRHLMSEMQTQGIQFGSRLGNAINALDDVWQERVTSEKYAAAALVLDYTQAYHCRDGATIIRNGSEIDSEAVSMLGFAYQCRSEWQTQVAHAYPEYQPLWDHGKWDDYIPIVNSLHRMDAETAAKECIRVARELFESETGEDSHSEQAQGKPDPSGSDSEGDGSKGGQQNQAGNGGEAEAESGGMAKADDGSDGKGNVKVSYKDLMGHEHNSDGSGSSGSYTIVYDHEPAFDYEPWETVTLQTQFQTNHVKAGKIKAVYDASAAVSQRILRLFQSESQTLPEHLHKRGRLTPKNLSRIATGDPRIFSKKINRIDRNTCIHVCLDFSGSMRGSDKFEYAVAAGAHLVKALDRINIPTRLTGFNDQMFECVMYELKGWRERVDTDTIIDRASDCVGGSNSDGDVLMAIYRDIMKQSKKRKIVIMLSDGQPASAKYGDCWEYTHSVIQELEKRIELYGVGIMDCSVEKLYKDSRVIRNPSDLETCLTEIVKQKIMRRV